MAEAGVGATNVNRRAAGGYQRAAVRQADSEAARAALGRYLEQRGLRELPQFAPEDDDELDAAVRDGRYDRVVFADLDALLTAMFKGDIRLGRWMELGVRIELAEDPEDANWSAFVRQAQASLARWRRGQRRRQIVACAILSAIALLAIASLLLLIPPAKGVEAIW